MKLFDRYMIKYLFFTTIIIAVILAAIILLTQSLRFLELVINSGASSGMFWYLTMLALPRFLEIIIPIAMMVSVIFTYNRMIMDSELVVMRSFGQSPMDFARPAIYLAIFFCSIMWFTMSWLGPKSLHYLQSLKHEIKAQYSIALFKEGIFNQIGSNFTVYIRQKTKQGELKGLMIHDSRKELPNPVTIIARKGTLLSSNGEYKVILYDGSRQEYDPNKKTLNKLKFDKYTINMPSETTSLDKRWKEPDERTLIELFNPDMTQADDRSNIRNINIEIHRRIITPFLVICYTLISLAFLLLGTLDRKGQTKNIIAAISSVVLVQALYIASYNIARNTDFGIFLMYFLVITPSLVSLFLLSSKSEKLRLRFLNMMREAKI